jgi:hypothetical protein
MLKLIKLQDNVSELDGDEAFEVLNPVVAKDGPIKIERASETKDEADGKEVFAVHGKNYRLEKVTLRSRDNRTFRGALAKGYMLEHLRNIWRANGETIILSDIDGKGTEETVNGQHRIIGFLMAIAAYIRRPVYYAKKYGIKSLDDLRLRTLVVSGCPRDAIDTIDGGQKRSGSDVMYRRNVFKRLGVSGTDVARRTLLSNALAVAARLVWLRTGGKKVSDAPKFPPSEMLTFLKKHTKLPEFVLWAADLDAEKEGNNVRQFMTIGYAAALAYLMSASSSETDENGKLDFNLKLEPKAKTFLKNVFLATNLAEGCAAHALHGTLTKRAAAGGSKNRDELVSLVVKAWNLHRDGAKAVSEGDLKLTKAERGTEYPRCGGLDTEPPEETPVEIQEEESDEPSVAKEAPKSKKATKRNPKVSAA